MPAARPETTTRHLLALFDGGSVVGLTDGELLDRFLSSPEGQAERAFEALVVRHGPLVWGVCRRILTDASDADDAFQATFLVLVRRARSVRVDDSLGRWLFGVSRKVAARIRLDRDRRRRRERTGLVAEVAVVPADRHQREAVAALDAEVARLAEPFRSAVVLCDLGGLTHEQAAREVGCPVGTIKSRLARGRDRLRDRLTRQGYGPTSAVPGMLAAQPPASLVGATLRAAITLAGSGGPIAGGVAGGWTVNFIFQGAKSMLSGYPLHWVAVIVVTLGMGATGWSFLADPPAEVASPPEVEQNPQPSAGAALPPASAPGGKEPREGARVVMPDYVVEAPDIIAVEVLEALPGRPITGERLVRPDGKISLGFYGEIYVAGLTTTVIKEKIVLHLRKYVSDQTLGLQINKGDQPVAVAPADTNRVFVDVVAYNSKVYYVQGDLKVPGRLPVTGNDTVLDAIHYAGGPLFTDLDKAKVRLIRPAPPGGSSEVVLTVDLAAIERGNPQTNYQIKPGDRVVVYHDPPMTDEQVFNRRMGSQLKEQQDRLDRLEGKLNQILQKLEPAAKP